MMVRLRVKVAFDGRTWFVNLPHYQMVPDTWRPVTDKKIHKNGVYPDAKPDEVLKLGPTVEVEVPDEHVDGAGRLDKEKIRAIYAFQDKWDHDAVTDDVVWKPS